MSQISDSLVKKWTHGWDVLNVEARTCTTTPFCLTSFYMSCFAIAVGMEEDAQPTTHPSPLYTSCARAQTKWGTLCRFFKALKHMS
jgi:hypothetical protein